ncbi:MAG: GreA/GreB family elongation factor [Phycisphaerae bacterium]|nr:GreA/GreB family elongation factor [Phycisphaerae bacterium]
MTTSSPKLTDLANRNEIQALEDLWMDMLESGREDREEMLEALAILTGNGKDQQAGALAWMWLETEQERCKPDELLDLVRELIVRCDTDDLRQAIVELYQKVYADRPEIAKLIDLSGLSGSKSVRRGLRTLDICLNVKEGDFLVSRSDENAAKVVSADPEGCLYTIRTAHGEETMDADALALAYDVAKANDFRVLLQMDPAAIQNMIEDDPTSLVLGILQTHRGRIDSDELAHMLSPRFIPAGDWKKWWSKAKADIKKCPNIMVEGKARTILTYHAQGQTLDDEILPQWQATETPHQRLAVIEAYFREARNRQVSPDPKMIARLRADQQTRINLVRTRAPYEALAEALVFDRLAEHAAVGDQAGGPAKEILSEAPDHVALLATIDEHPLYLRAIALLKDARPQDWPEIYARLLPLAHREACDLIAQSLIDAGRQDLLNDALRQIPTDFTRHLDAICWLWRGPDVHIPEVMPPREILLRLLDHLGNLTRSELTTPDVLRHAKAEIRASLSAAKYSRFQKVISEMDAAMASTVHRTIDRLDGLGEVVHADLLRMIIHTHSELIVPRKRIDPWTDENTIYCTQAGMKKREEELNHLRLVKIPENARAIGEAAARGDLSENSEYKFALEERDLLQARLLRIQNELAIGRLLTVNDISTDEVGIGTRVALQAVDGSERRDMAILGPWEADVERGVFNYQAPVCMKLRGLRAGDTVELDMGSGPRSYRIEAISNALESKAS